MLAALTPNTQKWVIKIYDSFDSFCFLFSHINDTCMQFPSHARQFLFQQIRHFEAPIPCHLFVRSFCFVSFVWHNNNKKKDCTFHTSTCEILFSDSLTFVWFNIYLLRCSANVIRLIRYSLFFAHISDVVCDLTNKIDIITKRQRHQMKWNDKKKNDAEKLVYVYVSNWWNLFAKKFKLNNSKSNIWKLVACSSQRLHCFPALLHRLAVDREYLWWIAVVIWWHCSKCHNF